MYNEYSAVCFEVWKLYISIEAHKETSIETGILFKFANKYYEAKLIYFYVKVRS
jgi:hypothetical protein